MESLIGLNQREKKILIKELLKRDRKFFFEFILSHYMQDKDHKLCDLHNEWFDLLSKHNQLGIVAPREHSKSSIINIADNLFDICNNGEIVDGKEFKMPYIVIISDTPEQAVEHLGAIVEELEGNELIHEYYGHLYEGRMVGDKKKDKWTQSAIITTNEVKVEAKGWRSKMRGMRWKQYRPSKIVIDDMENDEDVNSTLMREKLKKTFERKILPLGGPETKIRIVGTILHFDSLLQNEITSPRKGWVWKLYRAFKEDGSALWPEWWPVERLEARKAQIGSLAFEQEYMNNPIDPSVQILKPMEYYDDVDLTMCDTYGYIDLAISEKDTADWTALVTIARHRENGKLYVVEPTRIRGSILEQLDLVYRFHTKYKYKSFGVETVAYQKAFAQLLREESAKRGLYVPVVEDQQDKDKVRRAIEITPHIENGTILFNANYQDFMAEVMQFPKASHDDFVDAFVGAVKLALKSYTGAFSVMTAGGSLYPHKL